VTVDPPETTPPPSAPLSTPVLSPEHAQELLELATRLRDGGASARPKRGTLSSADASAKSRAYWATLSPTERRIRTLAARIGVGKATERELADLLAQLQAQQADAAEGGQP
jgi:hypothetical protein